jgi:hypothetical protein
MDNLFAFITNQAGGVEKADAFLEKDEWFKRFTEVLKDMFQDDFLLIINNGDQLTMDICQTKLVFVFKNKNKGEEIVIHEPLLEIPLSDIDRSKSFNVNAEFIAELILSHLKEERETSVQQMITKLKTSSEIRKRIINNIPWVRAEI